MAANSAPLTTNFNVDPYYDDYDEDKAFYRVLYKPGLAVQARELTQSQTIAQKQIERIGDNVFGEGTKISGCDFQLDANVSFVRLQDNDPGGNAVTVSSFANAIVTGLSSNVRAKVVATAAGVEADSPNLNTLLVKYISGGTTATNKTFQLNETLSFLSTDGGAGQQANTAVSDAFGFGTTFSIGDGLIYGSGHLIEVSPQTIILEKYSTTPSYKVGLDINEDIITFTSDESLLDPAEGAFNFTAPGADRLKLTANLIKKTLNSESANTFVPLYKIVNGTVEEILEDEYLTRSEIGRTLARRTFEESGNYFVKQINTHVKEHLNTGSNFGRFSVADGGDKDKLAIGIEPGLAYVQGYRNEQRTTEFIETDKATTTQEETGVTVTANYGNYIEATEVVGPWDPTTYQEVSLRDTVATAIGSGTLGNTGAPGSEIGTANVRFVEYVSGTPGLSSGRYRFYLFNINITANNTSFADVKSLYVNNGSGPDQFADVILTNDIAVLEEPSFNRAIFKTGIFAVKQHTNASNTVNTSFPYRDKRTVSFNVGGTATLTMGTPHAGGTEELDYGTGSLNDTQKSTFQVTLNDTVDTNFLPGNAVFSTSSNTITGNSGTVYDDVFQPGDFIKLANTGGSETSLLKVVSVASASSMVVNPQPDVDGGSLGGDYFKVYPTGYIFDMAGEGSDSGTPAERTITVASSTSATLDIKESLQSTVSATVFFDAQRESATAASKLVRKNRYVKLNLSTNSAGTAGPWNLGFADVFNLRNVYIGTTYNTTNRNVTKDFRVLKNSDDNLYKHSKLVLAENSSLVLTSADRLLVELDYFEHDRSGGIGFFSVDSYIIDPDEATSNTTAIATPQIPRYDSTFSDQVYDLRDSIDFRARISSTATDATVIGSATENPASSNTIDVDSDGTYVPVVNENFESDLLFYLPRIDRVVIGKDGKKRVIQGIPDQKPFPPLEPAESMTLSLLNIPPFPSLSLENAYNFDRVDQAVRVKPLFQRRYTMQDIQGIASRIDRLEYYTALNVLEKSAADLQIADANGLDRFKNGIFVDSFFGHDNADLTDPAYRVAVDKKRGEIRPRFGQQNIDLRFNTGTNITRAGDHVRLDVTSATGTYVGGVTEAGLADGDTVFVGSTLGTATASGTVRLVYSTGTNAFRMYLHDISGTFGVGETLNNNDRSGTASISAIQTAVDGDLVTMPYDHQIYIDQPWASQTINPVGELQFNWVGELQLIPEADHWVDTTTQPDVQWDLDLASNWQVLDQAWGTQWTEWENQGAPVTSEELVGILQFAPNALGGAVGTLDVRAGGGHNAIDQVRTTTTQNQVRTGTNLNVDPFTRTQSSGPFLTRTDIIPFMRSRVIQFQATGMRPNTKVFPYFDDISVTEYVTPTGGVEGGDLITDGDGKVSGEFRIPNDAELKFRIGERPFMLTDISDLVAQAGTRTTTATKQYIASGLSSSQRGIEFTTREATLTFDTERETRTLTSTTTGVRAHKDPVAQTFRIGDFEFNQLDINQTQFGIGADGVFISAIDLYFAEKSATAGIGVEIRRVEDGNITAERVPFGFKRIESADVNVSDDASVATPFYFDQPLYLRGDQEYAFIVKPDGSNPDYRMWIAELGGIDVTTGSLIDQQPAVGMLFTSANDRTFTPRQNQDVQFTLWRANFDTSLTATVDYVNEEDEYLEVEQILGRYNTGETIRGESILTMTSNTENIAIGDTVSFGANTGIVRKIVTSGATPTIKADMKGDITNGLTVTFTNASGSYTGVLNTFTANTTTGQIQYFDPSRGDIVANNSGGNFTANTTLFDGFYKGQSSNATSQVFQIKDFSYNVLHPKLSFARYVDTEIAWSAKTTANNYTISSTFKSIEPFKDNTFIDNEKIVAGKTSEDDNTSGAKTLTLRATMSTLNERISPVIDIGRTRSAILIHNEINNDNTLEFTNYGNAQVRYISKKVVLADGQEAEDLKVVLGAYRPPGTEIDVYARIQNAEDNDDFRDKHYTKLTQETGTLQFSSLTNDLDYIEYEYGFPSTNATSLGAFSFSGNNDVVRYSNESGANFDTFKSFSIKIVMRSTASSLAPRVRDLRAIALQI